MSFIAYRGGYRYQLMQSASFITPYRPSELIEVGKIRLCPDGILDIDLYFAWDGPSGPPRWISDMPLLGALYRRFLLPSILRGSLCHDALYEIMRHGKLHWAHRAKADRVFIDICAADGMGRIRQKIVHWAVRRAAAGAARPSARKVTRYAP